MDSGIKVEAEEDKEDGTQEVGVDIDCAGLASRHADWG